MIYVKVDKRKSIEKAISIIKKKVKDAGILLEVRERQEYKKKSAIKRKKRAQTLARMRQRKEKRPTKWL